MTLLGGIEAGGTKFVCAVGTGPNDIRAEGRFDTTTPEQTIPQVIEFFRQNPVDAIGIGSFGPVDPNPASPTFGSITSTPKPGWANTNLRTRIAEALKVPVGFETDVNVAAIGEYRWGAAQGLHSFIYLTVGTGIGGGAMVDGQMVHGMIHPETGHVYVPHDRNEDPYEGWCPFHGDCLEGLAAGPAIEKRWGAKAYTLPPDHKAWELESKYLAYALTSFIYCYSPQRIILGGGVMQQAHLFPMIRSKVQKLLNGYVQSPAILERIDEYIVPPGLGGRAGVLGCIALAESALK